MKNKTKSNRRKGRSRFGLGLAVYAAVLIVISAALLAVLTAFLAAYQASLEETALAAISENPRLLQSAEIAENGFYSADELKNALLVPDFEDKISFSRDILSASDDGISHHIYIDGAPVGEVSLVKGGKSSFGMQGWEIDKITLDAAAVMSEQSVLLPDLDGVTLMLNGREVGADFISETDIIAPSSSEFEAGESSPLKYVKYTVSTLSNPDFEAFYQGEALTKSEDSGIAFGFPPSIAFDIVISAPVGAEVKVNGVALAERHLSGEVEYPKIRSALDEGREIPTYLIYKISGLSALPTVEAVYLGEALTDTADYAGRFAFEYPDSIYKSYKITVGQSDALMLGDTVISADYITEKTFNSDLESLAINPVYSVVYEIENLLSAPDFKLLCADGGEHELINSGNEYTAAPAYSSELSDKYSQTALDFITDYIYYTACGYQNIEENHQKVLEYVYSEAEIYSVINRSKSAIEWNSSLDVTYNQMTAGNFVRIADNMFECEVDYDVTLAKYYVSNYYRGTYRLTFIETESGALLCDMINY